MKKQPKKIYKVDAKRSYNFIRYLEEVDVFLDRATKPVRFFERPALDVDFINSLLEKKSEKRVDFWVWVYEQHPELKGRSCTVNVDGLITVSD